MNHWVFNNQEIFEVPPGAFGFVYQITDTDSGMKYIGRKYLSKAKTVSRRVKLKNGTKVTKKKKSRVESDWMTYTGSCKPLNEQIEKLGKEKFKFEILAFGFTKGQVNFLEEYIQMKASVMIDDSYYNDSVGARGFIGVKFTDEFKQILREIVI